jgi:Periplasmic binding protein
MRIPVASESQSSAPRWRSIGIRMCCSALAVLVSAAGVTLGTAATRAGASSPADKGVTGTSISLGVPYVDFAALQSLGVTINDGSFPDAFTAVIAHINATGGIDGRKIVPHFVEMNPAVPASATSSCTQLTEDDTVFIAISPVFPDCYQQTYDTPVIAGSLPGSLPASAAPDFSFIPPNAAFDPVQLAAFNKRGAFKGKKVAIFYGANSDAPEVKVVQTDLKNLGVHVLLTAEDSAEATDAVASDQEVQSIAQRFQSAGVNVVVGVGGSGSTTWPRALLDNQSTYKPLYIATDEQALISYVESAKGNPYLDNVESATSIPSAYQEWQDPAIKQCATEVHKAYPSDEISTPANPTSAQAAASSTDTTFQSVIEACQYMALFAKIADAAGKHLTVASFTKAGYGLKNVTIPGLAGPISFGPNQPYAIGQPQVVVYDPTSNQLVPASSSSK